MVDAQHAHSASVSGPRSLAEELRVRRRLLLFAAQLSATLGRLRVELALADGDTAKDAVRSATKARTSQRLLDIFGVEVHCPRTAATSCAARPAADRGLLIVANHRTAFDIGVMMRLFGGVMLSRGDLASWPVIGPLAREGHTIFVDRDSGHSGARAIRAIRRALSARETVSVYPEGTTYIGDEVRPFSPGAFAAARGLPVDVLPVGLAYDHGVEYFHTSFMTHLEQVAARPRTRVVVEVGEPFAAEGKSVELAERAQGEVQALVTRARIRHDALPAGRGEGGA